MLKLQIGSYGISVFGPDKVRWDISDDLSRFVVTHCDSSVNVFLHISDDTTDPPRRAADEQLLARIESVWRERRQIFDSDEMQTLEEVVQHYARYIHSSSEFGPLMRRVVESEFWTSGHNPDGIFIIDQVNSDIHLFVEAGSRNVDCSLPNHILMDCLKYGLPSLLPYAQALMFHACGVVGDDGCYLFLGRSGTGKTTIARLSDGMRVLSDEAIVVRFDGSECWAYATPWVQTASGVPDRPYEGVPVRGLVLPVQSCNTWCQLLPPVAGASLCLASSNIMNRDQTGLGGPGKELSARAIELCSVLASSVPVYRLGFALNAEFWKELYACRSSMDQRLAIW